MPVEDCIEEYETMAGRVFGNPRHLHSTFIPTMWLNRPKFDATALEAVIGGVTRRRGEECVNLQALTSVLGSVATFSNAQTLPSIETHIFDSLLRKVADSGIF